ncbi:zinc-binding dehydrogenase [Rhodococcus sp. NPDC003318]|uniref:zinc-dependent alcohol dehydrogenase n=1 Tax=Rhodococcus sp. NPDC003318 TaxID=3364503 RepID=UPI00367C4775
MKAAIYNGRGEVEVVEKPTPTPGPRDVLLRNLHASICGSDVSAYLHGPQAHRIFPGSEFGHEMISEVAEVGREVTGLTVGERVYPYPVYAAGTTATPGTLGGFSEYILVRDCEVGKHVYPVDPSIPTDVAAMIEPFTVATHAARRANPRAGESAIVFGSGTIGIGAAVALSHLGCAPVMVVDVSDFRLAKAAELGFATCNSRTEDLRSKTLEVFGSARAVEGETADIDVVVEATGNDSIIGIYQDMAKLYSRMVVVGVHDHPVPVDMSRLAYSQQTLIGSGGYTSADVATVMDIMINGKFDLGSIVTQHFTHDRIAEALITASDVDRALNVQIVYSPGIGVR